MTRTFHILPALAFCLTLSGCYIPQVSRSSSGVEGRVVDASSHAPIYGVAVALRKHPEVNSSTGRSGYFRLSSTHYFRWLIVGPCSEYSKEKFYDMTLEVSHPGYDSVEINCHHQKDAARSDRRDGVIHLKDILLKETTK
jgi:hypothetical protein